MYSGMRIDHPSPVENGFVDESTELLCSPFRLRLDSTHFRSYSRYRPFPSPPSVRWFHVFGKWIFFFFITLCISFWALLNSKMTFEKFTYAKVHSVPQSALGSDRCILSHIRHNGIIQKSFISLKSQSLFNPTPFTQALDSC